MGIFIGGQEAVPIIINLVELSHPQPALGTPIATDNSTAQVCMKQSKALDMRYHWIKDLIEQRPI